MDRSLALPLPLRRPLRISVPRLPRLRRSRRPLLTLTLALLALPLCGGGWLWLRDSSLVAVEHVQVTGAHGSQAHAIDLALEEAATRMSTLHVKLGVLRAAVAPFRVVRDVRVEAGFPHSLRIRVIEQPPVAALVVDGVKTAVAADGVVLGPALLTASLPVLHGSSRDPLGVGRVRSASTLAALNVLGAAPPTLAGWVTRVYNGREGLTVAMRNGLQIYFGDATRPHAKWLSVARVLADSSSVGAWYLDVRLPERPAVGLSGAAAAITESAVTGATQVTASDPTAASLAASLAEAVNSAAGGGAVVGALTAAPSTSTVPGVSPTSSTGTAAPSISTATPSTSTVSPASRTSSPATPPSPMSTGTPTPEVASGPVVGSSGGAAAGTGTGPASAAPSPSAPLVPARGG